MLLSQGLRGVSLSAAYAHAKKYHKPANREMITNAFRTLSNQKIVIPGGQYGLRIHLGLYLVQRQQFCSCEFDRPIDR